MKCQGGPMDEPEIFRKSNGPLVPALGATTGHTAIDTNRQTNLSPNIDYTPEMYNGALVLVEDLCILISILPLTHYAIPSSGRPANDLVNSDVQREK